MPSAETIELMHFNEDAYLSNGEALVSSGKKMIELADAVTDEGYDSIFFMGVGGTWDEFMQIKYLMNKFGDRNLEVYLIHAAEWIAGDRRRMTQRSVVLTASESGGTPEIIEAVAAMQRRDIRVFAITSPDKPLGQLLGASRCVAKPTSQTAGGCEASYYLADCFGLRILHRRGCFPKFDAFLHQTGHVWQQLIDIRKRFERRAETLARAYALAPYTMFIGSGALWGETILFAMCILEEMQWKRTRYVSSADFFHGSLELVERDVPVVLFKGEDECRALDARVEAFMMSGATGDDDFVCIDTAEYAIPGLDPDFRVIVSPWILTSLVTDRLAAYYETVTKHNLNYRRYYHQFDY